MFSKAFAQRGSRRQGIRGCARDIPRPPTYSDLTLSSPPQSAQTPVIVLVATSGMLMSPNKQGGMSKLGQARGPSDYLHACQLCPPHTCLLSSAIDVKRKSRHCLVIPDILFPPSLRLPSPADSVCGLQRLRNVRGHLLAVAHEGVREEGAACRGCPAALERGGGRGGRAPLHQPQCRAWRAGIDAASLYDCGMLRKGGYSSPFSAPACAPAHPCAADARAVRSRARPQHGAQHLPHSAEPLRVHHPLQR